MYNQLWDYRTCCYTTITPVLIPVLHQGEIIASFGWETLSNPPYSPDLTPSNYHLFSPMREANRDTRFEDDEEIKSAIKDWLRQKSMFSVTALVWGLLQKSRQRPYNKAETELKDRFVIQTLSSFQ